MIIKIGIGAIFTANVQPLIDSLSKGGRAYEQFSSRVAASTIPIKKVGEAVSATGDTVEKSMVQLSLPFPDNEAKRFAQTIKGITPAMNEVVSATSKANSRVGQFNATVTKPMFGAMTPFGKLANSIKMGANGIMDSMGKVKMSTAWAEQEEKKFIDTSVRIPPVMKGVKAALSATGNQFRQLGGGIASGTSKIKSGLMGTALGLAPMTLAVGAGSMAAAEFQQQMSVVASVSRAGAHDVAMMTKEAKRMGIVSQFSATQSGEAMENMARAGATPKEIIAGLGGVMNAAAADGISLAQASDVVATIVRGMGMEWKDASHMSDVLALASSKSNTNILGLGEAFVYGAATARQMGISLEEQTSIFSKLADVGIRGSMAGTAFTNMMAKLAKPTETGAEYLKKFNVSLTNSDGSMRNIASIAEDFNRSLQKVPSVAERSRIATEVFGRRGNKAFNALAAAGAKATQDLEAQLIASSQGIGAAQEMASKRLDNLIGRITLLKSSLEGLAIGIFDPMTGNAMDSIKNFTDSLNGVLMALTDVNELYASVSAGPGEWAALEKKHGATALAIARGIADATSTIARAWNWIGEKFREGGSWLEKTFGADGIRSITKFFTLFALGASAIAPVILGLMGVGWVIQGIVTMATGVGTIIASLFWPAVIVAAALYSAWRMLREENESFLQTSMRVWGNIKEWAIDTWNNAIYPMYMGFKTALIPVVEHLVAVFDEMFAQLKWTLTTLFGWMFEETEMTKKDWKEVGVIIAATLVALVETAVTIISTVIKITNGAIKFILDVVAGAQRAGRAIYSVFNFVGTFIAQHFAKIALAIEDMFGGNFKRGIARFGVALIDGILSPLQLIIKAVVELAEKLDFPVPKGLKEFAKGGFTRVAGLGGPTGEWGDKMIGKVRFPKPKGTNVVGMKSTSEGTVTALSAAVKGAQASAARPDFDQMQKAVHRGVKFANMESPKDMNVNVDNTMCVDGETLAKSQSRHKLELQERAGFKATPWQRRQALEHGAVLTHNAS